MIRVYLGFDPAETIAYHVASHSILSRASRPVTIAPVGNTVLPKDLWWRERNAHDSTEFSNARFVVPWLAGMDGWAIFADCDVLCLADIAELWECRDDRYAVMVRKHDHRPGYGTKFLGAKQEHYARKNWSSLMLLNCSHPSTRKLNLERVNTAPGLWLHGLEWCADDEIGDLPDGWNELVEHGHTHGRPTKLAHYTQGGPWHGYLEQAFVGQWIAETIDMHVGTNPRAKARGVTGNKLVNLVVSYEQDPEIQS